LKYKSQALATLQLFCNYVVNQFQHTVKIVRSDNALEFDTRECQLFFANHGMVHQTSCVDRPQQNGRVERKYRHLLEMSRALRFHASLPLRFWGDCVLAATYIINQLPSSALQRKTPFEKLLLKVPDYHHMKVFGCLAFASNPARSTYKFLPRGVPCVFLGYPSSQKGYKLLNLLTNHTFVSRDVVFHEHIFPFSKSFKFKIKRRVPTPITEIDARCLDIDFTIDDPRAEICPASPASSAPPSPDTEAEVPVATQPSPHQHHLA